MFSEDSKIIEITFYAKLDDIPVADFPSTDIAKLLGSDITDTVPAFTGENSGFTVLNDYFGTAVAVEVEVGKEDELAAAYVSAIKELGYKDFDEDGALLISPNNQIIVRVQKGTIGTVSIEFSAAPTETWNAVRTARGVSELFDSKVVVPAYENGYAYTVNVYEDYMMIFINLADTYDVDEEVSAYEKVLETAGFTYDHADKDGTNYYISSDGKYLVNPYKSTSTQGVMMIYIDAFVSVPEWPADDVAAYLNSIGCSDVLPESTDMDYYDAITTGFDYSGVFGILVECSYSYTYGIYYAQQINEMGFKFLGYDENNNLVLLSPNEQYYVIVAPNSIGFIISIKKVPEETPPVNNGDENQFPMTVVSGAYSDAAGLLPELAAVATFVEEDLGSQVSVTATFADSDAASEYVTSYISALTTAGFVEEDWYGMSIYTYEGASFFVFIYVFDDKPNVVEFTFYPAAYL